MYASYPHRTKYRNKDEVEFRDMTILVKTQINFEGTKGECWDYSQPHLYISSSGLNIHLSNLPNHLSSREQTNRQYDILKLENLSLHRFH